MQERVHISLYRPGSCEQGKSTHVLRPDHKRAFSRDFFAGLEQDFERWRRSKAGKRPSRTVGDPRSAGEPGIREMVETLGIARPAHERAKEVRGPQKQTRARREQHSDDARLGWRSRVQAISMTMTSEHRKGRRLGALLHLRVPSDPLDPPQPFPAPEPSPPPVRRPPPDGPENPDVPLPGPEPIGPSQI